MSEVRISLLAQDEDRARAVAFVDGPGHQLAEVRCSSMGSRAFLRVIRWHGGAVISDESQGFATRDAAAERAAWHVLNLGASS